VNPADSEELRGAGKNFGGGLLHSSKHPSQVLASHNILTRQGRGWFQSGTTGMASGFSQSSRAYMKFFAAENWTDTAQGACTSLATTSVGTAPAVPATERASAPDGKFKIRSQLALRASFTED
jgi:hypothetical protein